MGGVAHFYSLKHGDTHGVIADMENAQRLRGCLAVNTEQEPLSVLYVPQTPDAFLDALLKKGHYGSPKEVLLGCGDQNDPLYKEQKVDFLESDVFADGERIIGFFHDAAYLYDIRR